MKKTTIVIGFLVAANSFGASFTTIFTAIGVEPIHGGYSILLKSGLSGSIIKCYEQKSRPYGFITLRESSEGSGFYDFQSFEECSKTEETLKRATADSHVQIEVDTSRNRVLSVKRIDP